MAQSTAVARIAIQKASADEQLKLALEEFRNKLSASDRAQLQNITSPPKDASEAITFVTELDRSYAQRSGRCVAARLSRFVQSVERFSAIVSTFVSSDPTLAAKIWGSIQFFLLMSSKAFAQFEKVTDLLMWIGQQCPRFSAYEQIFHDSQRLQVALCNFYAGVVRCCIYAYTVIQLPEWRNLLERTQVMFGSKSSVIQAEIRQLADEVKQEIRLASDEAQAVERRQQEGHRRDFANFFTRHKDAVDKEHRRSERQLERERRAERSKLLERLSPIDHNVAYQQIRCKRYVGTAEWLESAPETLSWLHSQTSATLWLSGKLGCGKSVATAQLVDYLFVRHPDNNKARRVYFFSRFNDRDFLEASKILRSLIRQCLDPESLPPGVEEQLRKILSKAHVSIQDLEDLFHGVLALSPQNIIVVDGMDDGNVVERQRLFAALVRVAKKATVPVKLLFTGRDAAPDYMSNNGPPLTVLKVPAARVREDIARFAECALAEKIDSGDLKLGDPALGLDIVRVLIDGAQEMFLWVDLMLDEICTQPSDHKIRQVLSSPPRTLLELYQRRLSRIRVHAQCPEALSALSFVAVARRPLTLAELQEALAVEPLSAYSQPERFINDGYKVLVWCQGLLIHDDISDEVHYAHSSMIAALFDQETNEGVEFETPLLDLSQCEAEFGVVCVTYLDFNDFKTQMVERQEEKVFDPEKLLNASIASSVPRLAKSLRLLQRRKEGLPKKLQFPSQTMLPEFSARGPVLEQVRHPFLAYAAENWLAHTRKPFPRNSLPGRLAYSKWSSLLQYGGDIAKKPWADGDLKTLSNSVLVYIVQEQHTALLSYINSDQKLRPAHIKAVFELGRSTTQLSFLTEVHDMFHGYKSELVYARKLMFEAIVRGNSKTLEEMLEPGAAIRALCDRRGPEFEAEALMQSGAVNDYVVLDVKSCRGTNGPVSALECAIVRGNFEVCWRLHAAGANPDQVDPDRRPLLIQEMISFVAQPAEQDQEEWVLLLVNTWGLMVALKALQIATELEREDILVWLISPKHHHVWSAEFAKIALLDLWRWDRGADKPKVRAVLQEGFPVDDTVSHPWFSGEVWQKLSGYKPYQDVVDELILLN